MKTTFFCVAANLRWISKSTATCVIVPWWKDVPTANESLGPTQPRPELCVTLEEKTECSSASVCPFKWHSVSDIKVICFVWHVLPGLMQDSRNWCWNARKLNRDHMSAIWNLALLPCSRIYLCLHLGKSQGGGWNLTSYASYMNTSIRNIFGELKSFLGFANVFNCLNFFVRTFFLMTYSKACSESLHNL